MSNRHRAGTADAEHGRATQRLDEAVSLRSRLHDDREAVKDTPDELKVDAALQAADDQVAARQRWLQSVEDHEYDRG
jgi:hypothetical protein